MLLRSTTIGGIPYTGWRNIAWKLLFDDAERVKNTFIVGGTQTANAQLRRGMEVAGTGTETGWYTDDARDFELYPADSAGYRDDEE